MPIDVTPRSRLPHLAAECAPHPAAINIPLSMRRAGSASTTLFPRTLGCLVQHRAVTRCRYTEAFVAQARSLTLERGQVEGVSIIAYDVGSAGGTVVLFCERHMLLLLLLLLPVTV